MNEWTQKQANFWEPAANTCQQKIAYAVSPQNFNLPGGAFSQSAFRFRLFCVVIGEAKVVVQFSLLVCTVIHIVDAN